MFFKKLDLLSPPIILYFNGDSSHSSIFSGVLTIIVYIINIGFGIYYSLDFFNQQNLVAYYYYTRFEEDIGVFPLNSSSLFSFLELRNIETRLPVKIDFDAVRIVGVPDDLTAYTENHNLSKFGRWLYDYYNNKSDIQGINNIINFQGFTGSECIRKYYNKENRKYYNTGKPGFKWPVIRHGISNSLYDFYGLYLEKCINDSLRELNYDKKCKSDKEITDYLKYLYVSLELIDNYVDVLNYEKPFLKFFYQLTDGIFENY